MPKYLECGMTRIKGDKLTSFHTLSEFFLRQLCEKKAYRAWDSGAILRSLNWFPNINEKDKEISVY